MAPQELKELEKVAPLLGGTRQLMGPQGKRHPAPAALLTTQQAAPDPPCIPCTSQSAAGPWAHPLADDRQSPAAAAG